MLQQWTNHRTYVYLQRLFSALTGHLILSPNLVRDRCQMISLIVEGNRRIDRDKKRVIQLTRKLGKSFLTQRFSQEQLITG